MHFAVFAKKQLIGTYWAVSAEK